MLALGYRYRRQPLSGALIAWHAGSWWLELDGQRESISPERWHCLPWVTWFAWRDSAGCGGSLWLFADSAERQMLRRLRVRLALER